eukprot:gene22548-29673_t
MRMRANFLVPRSVRVTLPKCPVPASTARPVRCMASSQLGSSSSSNNSSSSSNTIASSSNSRPSQPAASHRALSKPVQPPRGQITQARAQLSTVVDAPTISQTSSKSPIIIVDGQRVHSTAPRGLEVIEDLNGWASDTLLKYLKPSTTCWQPSDFLPDPSSPDFYDEVRELRRQAAALPTDYLVVLVGDMVTEEALPSYMNMLNTLDGCKDESGASSSPWAQWNRGWTAEENRHGDLLNKVDMKQVERSVQGLIGSGLDPKLENNPYLCFVYTSFQERATKISHANTARLATYNGNTLLARMCGIIAADEARHEAAYTAIVSQLFRYDPDGAMMAFADMMKKGIVMPAHYVDDGWHSSGNGKGANLFVDYATVADTLGVYTTLDYADVVDHLVQKWDVPNVRVVSGEAAEAQEFLVKHANRVRRLAELQTERRLRDRRRGKAKISSFSWVHKREVSLL